MRIVLASLLTLILTACAASGVDVPPPIVMTVVVTATPGGASAAASEVPPLATPAQTGSTVAPGYPPPFQNNVNAVYQDFEKGFMIYLADRQAIWVFSRSLPASNVGAWLAFADAFTEGEPEVDPNLTPPANFQQPKRGFGKVWRENPGVREALGWALDFERPYTALVTDYSIGAFDPNGAYSPQSFIHTITTLDSTLIHIDEATRIWSKP